MSDETITIPAPPTHEIDWDRVGTPRDIVAVLKAIGLNVRMSSERARCLGVERFVREIKGE